MIWDKEYRFNKLKKQLEWKRTDVDLVQFIYDNVQYMPEHIADVMNRFYLDSGTMRKDDSGVPEAQDSRFYQFLAAGRWILYTIYKKENEK